MKDEVRDLRSELERIESRHGPCVPTELRHRVAKWLREQRAEGRTGAELAAELGIAAGTVFRWSSEREVVHREGGAGTAIVPVNVVPDAATTARVAIVSPSGFRMEGITLEDAVRALRELA